MNLLIRRDLSRTGKGHAVAWALQRIPLDGFDAVFLIDADTLVNKHVLTELGMLLDVFAAVFVMGIAIFRINREFDHIDADRLAQLKE